MVRAITISLAGLNELEPVEVSVNCDGDLCLDCDGETDDGNRGERVLSEKVTGCESCRDDDNSVRSIAVVERDLGISVLEPRRIIPPTVKRQSPAPYPTFPVTNSRYPLSIS